MTIDAAALEALLHPHFARPMRDEEVLTRGVAASPGAASGEIAFSAKSAVELSAAGHDVILVRQRTEADDISGFHAAQGILTSTGGKASHAALVARGMGRPCVCGASGLDIDSDAEELHLRENGVVLHAGDRITLDGTSGLVTTAELPLTEPAPDERFTRVLEWADDMRTLGVRANADTPADARRASLLGAEGIGLCRTEHMFMCAERQSLMRAVVLARSGDQRSAALAKLLPLQQKDFEDMLAAMQGRPVTIRLLDPPLHEFLRDPAEIRRELDEHDDAQSRGDGFAIVDRSHDELRDELERTLELQEANPMLGTRGVRLGLLHPEIYEMQVAAIARALISTRSKGLNPGRVEIMVPLVAYENELKLCNELIESTASAAGLVAGEDFAVGTMIELPRACVMADLLAKNADFFSFGTNDLTQTTLGFSRDDIEGDILERYIDLKIIDRSPFEAIDTPGVGALVSMATDRGRAAHPKLELGVCGEHGGDPDSIAFFHGLGLDYVSCSPFRVPIARVAAAQAAIASTAGHSAQADI